MTDHFTDTDKKVITPLELVQRLIDEGNGAQAVETKYLTYSSIGR